MLRKRRAPKEDVLIPASEGRTPPPVNVVVVVESGRRRRRHPPETDGDDGHPLVKTVLGVAVAKRLMRRRKRPLAKRVKKAVRTERRKVKRTALRVRRALR